MKRLLSILLILTALLSFTACSGNEKTGGGNSELEGTLEDIMLQIYEGSGVDINLDALGNTSISTENSEYYLGVNDIDFEEAIASEPVMMGGSAHSICLLRLPEGADIDAVKTSIKDNVDGFKWVCAGVPDENIVLDNIGHTVVLIMDKDSDAYHNSFLALKGDK